MKKLVHGVGTNDADYNIAKCPFYSRWSTMLKRCYSEKYQKTHPTYKDCSVCDEWLIFSNFRGWMVKQDWQDKHLDKDILIQGNKVYSPESCLFIPKEINTLINDQASSRGDCPIGVYHEWQRGKFRSQCRKNGKVIKLGYFDSAEDAHKEFIKFKSKLVLEVSSDQVEPLKSALIKISKLISQGAYYKN